MLATYPGLSLVAAAGMAIAIAFGVGYFALVGWFLDARVPTEAGDRPLLRCQQAVEGAPASVRKQREGCSAIAHSLRA